MYYRGGRGVVPPAGIRSGQMTVKFHGWPRDMATQMCLWHIVMAEQPYVRLPLLRQMVLEHCQCHIGVCGPHGNLWHVREAFTGHDIVCCQVVQYGGTHSAALRSALLPLPASSLPRELVSGRHLPLPEAVGWPRPPYRTTCQTTWR